MGLSFEERRRLLQANLPEARAVRERLRDYLARAGMLAADFAPRLNYSKATLHFFLSGRYEEIAGSDSAIRHAITRFMDAHPIGEPETIEGKVYESEDVRVMRKYFNEALDHHRTFYLEGPPGTGKSYVLQHLVAELNREEMVKNGHGRRAFYIYCAELIRPRQFLKDVAIAAGSSSVGDVRRVIRNLRFDLGQRRVLLVFDEAQHLNVECLETVRELYDLPPRCGMLFAGSHELKRLFTLHALELEQFNSRFPAGRTLTGPSKDEAIQMARAELGPEFPQAKIEKLVEQSRARALASSGEREYISLRRLFETLKRVKAAMQAKGEGA